MSNNREGSGSPDWLREFQAPKQFVLALSSDSDSSPNGSPLREDVILKKEKDNKTSKLPVKDKNQDVVPIESSGGETPLKVAKKTKGSKLQVKVENHEQKEGNEGEKKALEEEITEKPPPVSSRMPLVISEKVHRSKVLIECEGDSIDLSGDVGAVGRVVISDAPSGDHEMLLDLKGTIYKTTIVPSRTFCIVGFSQAEAKIEAIMNDFIQLKPQSNVYEAETMIEGTLDGFSFDSDEEADKIPKAAGRQIDQNDEAEEPTNEKTKKKVQKSLGVVRKKGKTAGKPLKKGKRKSQAPKKAKNAKK